MRSPCREDGLFPLALPKTDGPIIGKSREKVESLSFSLSNSSSQIWFCLSLSPNRYRSQVRCPLTYHLSNSQWLLGLPLSPYPSTLDFPPIICCHMSLLGPTSAICLTSSPLDTCLILSHSIAPSVPHYSWCLKKHEILTVSEFNVVARFREMIPMVKFVSSSEILKNSIFLTEIIIFPFFRKLEFFGVLQICAWCSSSPNQRSSRESASRRSASRGPATPCSC